MTTCYIFSEQHYVSKVKLIESFFVLFFKVLCCVYRSQCKTLKALAFGIVIYFMKRTGAFANSGTFCR